MLLENSILLKEASEVVFWFHLSIVIHEYNRKYTITSTRADMANWLQQQQSRFKKSTHWCPYEEEGEVVQLSIYAGTVYSAFMHCNLDFV